jgi:hypothetical protein
MVTHVKMPTVITVNTEVIANHLCENFALKTCVAENFRSHFMSLGLPNHMTGHKATPTIIIQ